MQHVISLTRPERVTKSVQLVLADPIPEVVMPIQSFVLKPKLGEQLVGGDLLPVMASHRLDTMIEPPGTFQDIRDDLAKFAKIPITRVAMKYASHAYSGIIDSSGDPYFFALNTRGLLLKKAPDDEVTWRAFDQLRDAEQSVGIAARRIGATQEQAAIDQEFMMPTLVVAKSLKKALPKKDKSAEPVKKTPSRKSTKKKAGAKGKTRYSYPQDKNKDKPRQKLEPGDLTKPQTSTPQQLQPQQPVPTPPAPQPPQADPTDLANQLGVSIETLKRVAKRFVENPKLGGEKGFVTFMKTRLQEVAEKHHLDGDYFHLIWAALAS